MPVLRNFLLILFLSIMFSAQNLQAFDTETSDNSASKDAPPDNSSADALTEDEEFQDSDEDILIFMHRLFWMMGYDSSDYKIEFFDGLGGGRAIIVQINSSRSKYLDDLDNCFIILGKAVDSPKIPVANLVVKVNIQFKELENFSFIAATKSVLDYSAGRLNKKSFYKSYVYRDIKSTKE